MGDSFFSDIRGFTSFSEACDPRHYHQAPDDWYIVLADVQESTAAIRTGRYKDVNMVGAACITALVNTCRDVEIPYVFGGDGATLLIPPGYKDAVQEVLLSLREAAKTCHNLALRIGLMPVGEITRRGKRLEVARYRTSTGCSIAMFNGGGVSLADALVKQGEFCIDTDNEIDLPDLTGLSCRWQPIPARKGMMLSLLVMATHPDDNGIYDEINRFISDTLGTEPNPVHPDSLAYKWPSLEALRQCRMVWRQGRILVNLLDHVFWISLVNILHRINGRLGSFDVVSYRQDMIANSDYRKFDDMLRMVVDCSPKQAETIERYLEMLHQAGRIAYGAHQSDTALMTCFVKSLASHDHVHFIDGNNGGYAMAAMQLKQQLKQKADTASLH